LPRTNIAIDDDIADQLSDQAMRRNKTLYAFANESLEAVISVCKLAGEPSDVLPSWKMGRMLRDVDAVPLPGDLVEKLIKKLFETQKDWLLKAWFEEGKRIGNYLGMGIQELTSLAETALEFQGLLPLKRIEIRNIDSGESKGQIVIRAIGAGLSTETTACAEQFMRGIIDSYGWFAKGSKMAEGIIEIRASKSKL
jgi:hypothetical protein